jgi:hypothetical protein
MFFWYICENLLPIPKLLSHLLSALRIFFQKETISFPIKLSSKGEIRNKSLAKEKAPN